jgi:hypothetical protein
MGYTVNWRRGLFRIWVVLSALWAALATWCHRREDDRAPLIEKMFDDQIVARRIHEVKIERNAVTGKARRPASAN